MAVPFPDLDPYATLSVPAAATPEEIRKLYRQQCLRYHPDKLGAGALETDRERAQERFEKVQFAYGILLDTAKRGVYDETQLVQAVFAEDGLADESEFWRDYFKATRVEITPEMIEQDRAAYQGLEEERADIVAAFIAHKGRFLDVFEVVPHLEFSRELEARVFAVVEAALEASEAVLTPLWTRYCKNREREIKRLLRVALSEAAEAAEAAARLGAKTLTEDELRLLIVGRQRAGFEDMIGKLESKYGGKPAKRRGKVQKAKHKAAELDDEEFERVQQAMLARRGQ